MTIAEYISTQLPERQEQFTALHEAILANDKTVTPVVEKMMRQEMILYKERGYMKYGLAGVKNYMSLHCLPMYMNPVLHTKFEGLLPNAKFQKGCINFTGTDDMPMEQVTALIADCAGISIADMIENRKKKK